LKEAKEMGLIKNQKRPLLPVFGIGWGVLLSLITDEKDPKWVLLGKILGTSSTACCHAVATANV